MNRLGLALIAAAALGTAACRAGGPAEALSLRSETGATQVMVFIAKAAQTCWFRSRDKAFADFRMANEINSPAGRPRILLVPKSDPAGLPLLVVQAEASGSEATGRYTDVQTFGPILATDNGSRIASDVRRWASGRDSCA